RHKVSKLRVDSIPCLKSNLFYSPIISIGNILFLLLSKFFRFLTKEIRSMRDEKSKHLQKLLQEVCSEYTSGIVFSTSLSMEDQVITHHIFSNNLPISVFTLDTGRLFPETYKVLENTRNRYKKPIQVFFPNHSKVEEL